MACGPVTLKLDSDVIGVIPVLAETPSSKQFSQLLRHDSASRQRWVYGTVSAAASQPVAL